MQTILCGAVVKDGGYQVDVPEAGRHRNYYLKYLFFSSRSTFFLIYPRMHDLFDKQITIFSRPRGVPLSVCFSL